MPEQDSTDFYFLSPRYQCQDKRDTFPEWLREKSISIRVIDDTTQIVLGRVFSETENCSYDVTHKAFPCKPHDLNYRRIVHVHRTQLTPPVPQFIFDALEARGYSSIIKERKYARLLEGLLIHQ